MTKTTSKVTGMAILVIIFFAMFGLVISVNAAERSTADRDRGEDSRTTTPTPPPAEEPVTEPTPPPANSSGGITNVTTGEVESGGNTGGNVTTGDESVEINIVNEGPVNISNGIEITSGGQSDPSPTETPCSSDRRTSNACSGGETERAR